jgi:hypothetical protein
VIAATSSEVTTRNCIAGASGCDSISRIVQSVVDGAPGNPTTASSAVLSQLGYQATASANLNAPPDANGVVSPVLNTVATSTAGTREAAEAWALQSYTYTGAAATQTTFGGTVTYSQSINGSYPQDITGSGTAIGLEVFTLAPGQLFSTGTSPIDNDAALADAFAANTPVDDGILQTNFTALGADFASDSASNAAGSLHAGVTVNLVPNETVWIVALLESFAPNGSTVDPTFKTQWSNSAGLVNGVVSAPEIDTTSAASGLTLLLGALAVLRRRGVRLN